MALAPRFKKYVDDTIKLVRSIVVKTAQTIDAQNYYLIKAGGAFETDRNTWRYYLNMEGEYHYANPPMYVISSDTREEILFSKENLKNHPITRSEYMPGTDYFNSLMDRYPQNKLLIPRIINPIDKATAINARNFQILWYDPQYIYDGEVSLMYELQKWLDNYSARWNVPAFATSDRLYPAAFLAQMYIHMVTAILKIRVELARTSEADDFHIWSFLASRYRLDQYRDDLSYKQAAYLYRNIDYLRQHAGKESTFISLLENIAHPADIYARKFDIALSYEDYLINRNPTPVYLEGEFESGTVDRSVSARRDGEYIYTLTENVAKHNKDDVEEDIIESDNRIKHTTMNVIPTGVVELYKRQSLSSIVGNIHQTRMALWIYLASNKKYSAAFNVTLGDVGTFRLTAAEGLVLLCYAIKVIHDIPEDTPPSIFVQKSFNDTPVPRNLIDSLITKRLDDIGAVDFYNDSQIIPTTVVSKTEFEKLSNEISFNYFKQRLFADRPHHSKDRSQLKSILSVLYPSKLHNVALSSATYVQWLEVIAFPYKTLTKEDYIELTYQILKEIALIDVTEDGIGSKSKAVVDILSLLSAYNITFVRGAGLKPYGMYDTISLEPDEAKTSLEYWTKLNGGLYGETVGIKMSETLSGINIGTTIQQKGPVTFKLPLKNDSHMTATHTNVYKYSLNIYGDFIGRSNVIT